ncbi:predicted protein [Lichtheimia corymbifera JMRC:FSU:9682]|uniref:HMG box domain-containing protein n=2 Tax=Lichtheimia corymbifera JMRC:FSU:9682 TaxID=1263082 RepID=A0A068RW01_9FUNG|nr:predicted protein [Lichtheimia corymbifera JMRC:FSU:9682]
MSQETSFPIPYMIPDLIDDTKTEDVKILAEQTMIHAGKQRRRRTRTRGFDPNHIPRPVNCFMLYRIEMQKYIRKHCPYANHREISKIVAKWWHQETEEIKNEFRSAADKVKMEHRNKYPEYKYAPKKKKQQEPKQRRAVSHNDHENNAGERLDTLGYMSNAPWRQQPTTLYGDEKTNPGLYMPHSQYYMLSPDTALPSSHLPSLDYPLTSVSASLHTPVWDHDDGYKLDMPRGYNSACALSSSSCSPSSLSPDMWSNPLSSSSLPSCNLEAYAAAGDNMQLILAHHPIISPWDHSFVPVGQESMLVEPLSSDYSSAAHDNA